MACRCQRWILQQSQQQLQIWDLSSVPAFALPCFCAWLGWAKFLLLRWRTLAHYRGSQRKMCQGINAYLKSIFRALPALQLMVVPAWVSCVLYLCPPAAPPWLLAPLCPGLRSLHGASLIPCFQQHSCFLWQRNSDQNTYSGGQRGEGKMPTLTSAL